ncbi:DUF4190 domain-containing protein [Allobranchiibius huperziae]|uniref:DUF4190 domain-containing protein n=1 Tax=Allobranchiibius huperziae TaxID=1874116 RepID=A0A853DAZ6_9MICO|nr:DUF4190 domain-containing protein [Allobranchiibius huperziae]NYJ74118.1 hypothetical protein [Allobranchiibius huperziae]
MSYDQSAPPPPPGDYGQGGGFQQGDLGGGPVQPQRNQKALIGLICSIVGFLCCGVLSIVGIVLGVLARNEIRASGGRQEGEGMATAAIIVGIISLILGVVIAIVRFAH